MTELLGDPPDRATRFERQRREGVARRVELERPDASLLRRATDAVLSIPAK